MRAGYVQPNFNRLFPYEHANVVECTGCGTYIAGGRTKNAGLARDEDGKVTGSRPRRLRPVLSDARCSKCVASVGYGQRRTYRRELNKGGRNR